MRGLNKNNINPPKVPPIKVKIDKGKAEKTEFCFTEPFRIGRDSSCEIQISGHTVSRAHAEIWYLEGRWWIHDLQSANGILVDGKKVERAPVGGKTRVELGLNGPVLSLITEEIAEDETTEGISEHQTTKVDRQSLSHYVDHYLTDSEGEQAGLRTMMIRRAFEHVQKKQKRKFAVVIGLAVFLVLCATTFAVLKHIEARRQRQLAEDIFYAIKSLELEFAGFLRAARLNKDAQSLRYVEKYREKRKEMEASYDELIKTDKTYGKKTTERERIILKIARTFGECEVNMPPEFLKEVQRYIEKWKSSKRLENAIARARENGYISKIADTMVDHDLPPHFLYLALQESNFDVNACGPKTRYGIAKGMWQFIPSTAANYGLRTGPLVRQREPDSLDDRHHFGRSTLAAARYLRDIYDTEAQASGLLVIASYNWGEGRVIKLLREMPENPRERNFWLLLTKFKKQIPRQTHDYVFHIVSAAVIGENPRLFGFDFDSPMAEIASAASS